MREPFQRSIDAAEQICQQMDSVLKNCVKSGEQPTQETVNGMQVALEALRNSEGKMLDRLNKSAVDNAKTIYSQ